MVFASCGACLLRLKNVLCQNPVPRYKGRATGLGPAGPCSEMAVGMPFASLLEEGCIHLRSSSSSSSSRSSSSRETAGEVSGGDNAEEDVRRQKSQGSADELSEPGTSTRADSQADLDFWQASRILMAPPSKPKRLGFDFHLWQALLALVPPLAVYTTAMAARAQRQRLEEAWQQEARDQKLQTSEQPAVQERGVEQGANSGLSQGKAKDGVRAPAVAAAAAATEVAVAESSASLALRIDNLQGCIQEALAQVTALTEKVQRVEATLAAAKEPAAQKADPEPCAAGAPSALEASLRGEEPGTRGKQQLQQNQRGT